MPEAKYIKELIISRKGNQLGVLRRIKLGCEFEYLPNAVSDVCFSMSRAQSIYKIEGDNLLPFFANLLPEGRRLETILTKERTSKDDLFTALAATGNNLIGDVEISPSQELVEDIDIDNISFRELREQTQNHAGMQDKMSARAGSILTNIWGENALLKFSSYEYPNLVENEYICLKTARACGLKAAEATILTDKNGDKALAVFRFDRIPDGYRRRQEDGCQVLGVFPSEKDRVSYQKIIEQMATLTASPLLSTVELLKQYFFAYMIGNSDLHAKNVSLLENEKLSEMQVSPIYDSVCTLLYPKLADNMILPLLGKTKNFERSFILERIAPHFKIPPQLLDKELQKMSQNIVMYMSFLSEVFEPKNSERVLGEISRRVKEIRRS
jgi:serine/threonine-protein kinase HipA